MHRQARRRNRDRRRKEPLGAVARHRNDRAAEETGTCDKRVWAWASRQHDSARLSQSKSRSRAHSLARRHSRPPITSSACGLSILHQKIPVQE